MGGWDTHSSALGLQTQHQHADKEGKNVSLINKQSKQANWLHKTIFLLLWSLLQEGKLYHFNKYLKGQTQTPKQVSKN
jgi:hypothetical protein